MQVLQINKHKTKERSLTLLGKQNKTAFFIKIKKASKITNNEFSAWLWNFLLSDYKDVKELKLHKVG